MFKEYKVNLQKSHYARMAVAGHEQRIYFMNPIYFMKCLVKTMSIRFDDLW